jgi:chemotaxis protein methyltransferase CheR
MKAQYHQLADPLLARLSEFLSTQIGLYFPRERWDDLERGVLSASGEFGFAELEECVCWLLSARLTHQQIEILAGHLTIGETYFFRDQKSFAALERHVFPEIIDPRRNAGRRINIWCAGCCTGEEPYSIAMLLDRLLPDYDEWSITILATDINPQFLRTAEAGVYGEWSFRNAPAWAKSRYFTRQRSGRFEIHPRIKKKVTFSYLNLVSESLYPWAASNTSGMDLIFCRNVLMYFNTEQAANVTANFYRVMPDGGWLIVSPTETSQTLFSQFSAVNFPGAIFYRKNPLVDSTVSSQTYFQPMSLPPTPAASVSEPVEIALPVPITEINVETSSIQAEQNEIDQLCSNARLYANLGKLTEAALWCARAINMDKLNPHSHYLMATIQQEMGLVDEAEKSLSDTIYLAPDFPLAHFALGNLCLSRGRQASAQRYFATTLTLLRNHPPDEILAESEGLPAARLAEMVASVITTLAPISDDRSKISIDATKLYTASVDSSLPLNRTWRTKGS